MKQKLSLIILIIIVLGVFALVSGLIYREYSPKDNSAATTYYIAPDGNDNTGNGSNGSPWKTIQKANSSISPGDTVILKDGVYTGYATINKNNTTWEAQNKHKAIIDGGFSPGSLNNNWNNIVKEWDTRCKNIGEYSPLLAIQNASNVTIDGLFLRNSCGRGFGITTSTTADRINDNTVKNIMIDWTFNSGFFANPGTNNRDHMQNFQFIDNIMTRVSIGDEYNVRVAGACQPKDTKETDKIKKYCVNISAAIGGTNTIIRGNLIAWGEGEVAPHPGSKGLLFEDNILIGNKNSFYPGMVEDAIVRNNLFYAPESSKTQAGGSEDSESNGNWRFGLRNETGHPKKGGDKFNTNIAIYNNLIINTMFFITGSNNNYIGDNNQIYFGNNTMIAGESIDKLIHINHGAKPGVGDPIVTGLFENNIFDTSKKRSVGISILLSGNDKVTFRNNIFPNNSPQVVKGGTNIITDNPGLVNAVKKLDLIYPNIGPEVIDIAELLSSVDIGNYRLKQDSPGINAGSSEGPSNNTQIPAGVRTQDFLKNTRIGLPDIGAIEYGGIFHTSTPTPIQSSTPTPDQPSHSVTPTPDQPRHSATPTPGQPKHSATPTPTSPQGNICGRADVGGDGVFNIFDFIDFASAYGMGTNTCADKDEDYGPCGGRDVNRDGKLNISDFGQLEIGFAQRYYPKTSCAL